MKPLHVLGIRMWGAGSSLSLVWTWILIMLWYGLNDLYPDLVGSMRLSLEMEIVKEKNLEDKTA